MAEWKRNNRACTTTWTTLRILDQNTKVFKDSGSVLMTELTFWNPLASAEMRQLQATSLTGQIDNVFREIRRAGYEDGIDRDLALAGMLQVLKEKSKTIADLAEVADKLYFFWGEDRGE